MIIAGTGGTSEAWDQATYHLPVIRTMADEWPRVDIVNYRSTTSPGYHLALAMVVRYVTDDVTVLRLLSSLATLGLLLVAWAYAARGSGPAPALVLVLPLLGSTYVVGGAIWLTTDNAALLFVALALGGATFGAAGGGRTVVRAGFATAAVFVRQIHLWVVAPVAVAALLASPAGARLPSGVHAGPRTGWGGFVAGVAALLVPFALLAWLVWKWGGLTPPAYAHIHATGVNPANLAVILALFGVFGLFFLPVLDPRPGSWIPADRVAAIVVLVVLVGACAFATSFDKEAGRWGGAIWGLVEAAPAIGRRSLVLPPLAAYGAFVLLRVTRAGIAAGRTREIVVLLVGAAAWAAAQAFNAQAWQRYCEPMVLLTLAWAVALAWPGAPGAPPRRRWWIGPALLAVVQSALLVRAVYLALET